VHSAPIFRIQYFSLKKKRRAKYKRKEGRKNSTSIYANQMIRSKIYACNIWPITKKEEKNIRNNRSINLRKCFRRRSERKDHRNYQEGKKEKNGRQAGR
jgi:hypothetical protein